ncbi:MAG: apiosidase-like domain-containing protein [Anaerolineae bacterium]
MMHATQNCASEWAYSSGKVYRDPFNDVELDIVFTDPDGEQHKVPAFWAGEQTWRVRYAPLKTGRYHYCSVCSDNANAHLHGQEGILEVAPYEGSNPLLRHGPLRVATDCRHLEHCDGTPFFWLGDTWWMGFCKRLRWPEDFQELTADRVAKGFSVIQIVAGLYPDMEPFDPRGANEAGFPWERDFTCINPTYFDMADLRIAHLVRSGLVPCIVGSWGYFMDFTGVEVLKKHWRNLVARYSAYPVVWCVAGEALMLYYLRKAEADAKLARCQLRARWSELVRAIRALDPYGHPITIHPTQYGHEQVDDPSLLDLDMLQTGHSGHASLANTVDMLEKALAHEPRMPVLVGEVNYEGIMESGREEMQRFQFWTCMLSGAAGHTYGANGIWQVNTREQPYGRSPHGTAWGNRPWEEAYRLPGSGQLGLGKRLLQRYPWWQFEPHPEWVEPHQEPGKRMSAYAAGISDQVRLVYFPAETSWVAWRSALLLKGLDPGHQYRGFYFDPATGHEYDLGTVTADAQGNYVLPKPPIFQDWVVVVEW